MCAPETGSTAPSITRSGTRDRCSAPTQRSRCGGAPSCSGSAGAGRRPSFSAISRQNASRSASLGCVRAEDGAREPALERARLTQPRDQRAERARAAASGSSRGDESPGTARRSASRPTAAPAGPRRRSRARAAPARRCRRSRGRARRPRTPAPPAAAAHRSAWSITRVRVGARLGREAEADACRARRRGSARSGRPDRRPVPGRGGKAVDQEERRSAAFVDVEDRRPRWTKRRPRARQSSRAITRAGL